MREVRRDHLLRRVKPAKVAGLVTIFHGLEWDGVEEEDQVRDVIIGVVGQAIFSVGLTAGGIVEEEAIDVGVFVEGEAKIGVAGVMGVEPLGGGVFVEGLTGKGETGAGCAAAGDECRQGKEGGNGGQLGRGPAAEPEEEGEEDEEGGGGAGEDTDGDGRSE